ncbi:prepilin-type N-terminal cleavage/methylation domain-containing protein [Microbacterium sp. MTN4-26]|uniref:prepilin-type N-terminal cleavage/methylation domain-containing protein n=1 Tax=unclassified Microbacterium TaxID=2609290 RepID=UPI0036F25563
MTTYIAALRRRKENGDAGFSLIELIVVVVILGVLAAIAVPVFLGLQGQAEQSAVDTAAANGASQAAADFAQGDDATAVSSQLTAMSDDYTLTLVRGDSVENYCVTARSGDRISAAGPACVEADSVIPDES